jgi:hypothetical protein
VAGKSVGKTVLGWFVVNEDGTADPSPPEPVSADDLIAKYAKPQPSAAPPEPPPVAFAGELPKPPAPGGSIDFLGVYRAANISQEEQDRVEKARSLLSTLPKETPKEVKKQIVEASLKAFGVPVDKIIEAGAQEIQALEAYIRHGEMQTQSLLGESTTRIEQLSQEIVQIKKIMEDQVASQQSLTRASNDEKLRVQEVLEFFGQEAIARVVHASPKLIEPK